MPENADRDDPPLALRGVVKRFGGLAAVDGVSLDLRPGEILGVIGPNGAGKTTLFDIAAGATRPDEGEVLLGGARVEREPAQGRTGRGLGRTFQIPRPFAEMTVLENALVAGRAQAGERFWTSLLAPAHVARQEAELRERAREALDFLSLGALADEPARVLSGGQRKLLELARVLVAEPRVLLLDEPAAGVNPALMAFVMERIERINAGGVSVLLIEHDMGVVSRLCSRAVVMAQGRAIAEGTAAEVLSDAGVVEAYLGGAPQAAA